MAAPKTLSTEDYSHIVQQCLGANDFKIICCEERKLSEEPMGLLGDHFSTTVTVQRGSEQCDIKFFVKTFPINENQVKLIEETGAFKKEVIFYSVLVEELKSFNVLSEGLRADNDEINNKTWLCRCYLARSDVLVLEDLTQLGFFGFNPRDVLDFHHTTLILQKLALFHASSLILEEKQSESTGKTYRINEVHPELIKETFYVCKPNHPGEMLLEASVNALIRTVKLLPVCKTPDIERNIDEILSREARSILELVKPSKKYRNVLCHADMWSNNILCRYGENRNPIDAILVDFQLIRYSPPTQDIFNFLYLMTRRAFREAHLKEFLSVYYRTLSEELRLHHLDPEKILPWSELLDSCEEQQHYGRINAWHCLHFVTIDREVLKKIMMDSELYQKVIGEKRAEIVCEQFQSDNVYRERMTEVLNEFLECHVLQK
ncbi:uncharacterized protein [Anabrus simplex]|uniref:uncharacterized protein n=1 Tax=Anabrus simplex TaxID=316456 RepID=UPI0034DDC447